MSELDTARTGAVRKAADLLYEATRSGVAVVPVRNLIGETDLEAAYAVQEVNTQRALVAGRRLVGRKIGLTSVAVQKQLGVEQPDYGMLFADMARTEGRKSPLMTCSNLKSKPRSPLSWDVTSMAIN